MTQSTFIQTRVSPELAERFHTAAQVDGRTTSEALRHLMLAYIASVAASVAGSTTDDAAPGESGVAQAYTTTRPRPRPTRAGHT